jgi:small subunit ribosomal protein S13
LYNFFNDQSINKEIVLNILKGVPGVSGLVSKKVCSFLGVPARSKVSDLDLTKLKKLRKVLVLQNKKLNFKVVQRNRIRIEIDIQSYKGLRHLNCLPVSGQRTRSNAKTQKRLSKHRFSRS